MSVTDQSTALWGSWSLNWRLPTTILSGTFMTVSRGVTTPSSIAPDMATTLLTEPVLEHVVRGSHVVSAYHRGLALGAGPDVGHGQDLAGAGVHHWS